MRQPMMIKKSIAIVSVGLTIALSSFGAEEKAPNLPGYDVTVEKVVPLCDSIVVAKLVTIGPGMLRMPGYITFHDNRFKILKSLKGKLNGTVTMIFYLKEGPSSELPKESVNYIVLSYVEPRDGYRRVGKMLLATKNNKKNVSGAIDAARGEILLKLTTYYTDFDGKTKYNIERLDVKQTTSILQIGQTVPGTKYRLVNLTPKGRPVTGEGADASELTLVHSETGRVAILILDEIVGIRSPDSSEPKSPK
jgi:hypothetical protein